MSILNYLLLFCIIKFITLWHGPGWHNKQVLVQIDKVKIQFYWNNNQQKNSFFYKKKKKLDTI